MATEREHAAPPSIPPTSQVVTADFKANDSLSHAADSGTQTATFQGDSQRPGHETQPAGENAPELRERYALTSLHAKGGLGQVWLARDSTLGREVALKELKPEVADRSDLGQRFYQEATITSQLQHPGIVPIYELGRRSDTGQPFYTMRFIKGRTLAQAARDYHRQRAQGRLDPLERAKLLNAFVSVCNTIAYAHARGVIHRDLKGQNVALGDYGEVIVLDWGLAKVVGSADPVAPNLEPQGKDEHTVQGEALGTPAYMAPEQAAGQLDQVGPASDIYGLGAILFEILTGRPPFVGKDVADVLRKVREEEPPRPRQLVPETPPPLEAICLRALRREPAQRYASASDLAKEVQRWLADEPVAAYVEPLPARLGRWARRHRTLVSGGLALLLTTLAALVVGIVLVGQEQQRTAEKAELAQKNEKTANAQRDLAKASLALGLRAVNDSFTQISENALLNAPGMQEHRKKLQQAALGYFKDFLEKWADDPDVKTEVALAYYRIGDILIDIGSDKEARAQLAQAYVIQKELADNHPESLPHQRALMATCSSLGVTNRRLHDFAASIQYHRESIVLHEKILGMRTPEAADPSVLAEREAGLAGAYNNLGRVYLEAGDLAAAQKASAQAVALVEKLVAVSPPGKNFGTSLAQVYFEAGLVCRAANRNKEALHYHSRARDILESLPEAQRRQLGVQQRLGNTYNSLGLLLWNADRHAESREHFEKALAIRAKLAAENPAVINYKAELFSSSSNLALLLLEQKKSSQAIPHLQRACHTFEELQATGQLAPANRQLLARCYLRLARELRDLGKPAEAVTILVKYRDLEPLAGQKLFDLACDFALCAAAPTSATFDRERCRELALQVLQEAVNKGFHNVELLQSHPSLAVVRDHPALARLLQELRDKMK